MVEGWLSLFGHDDREPAQQFGYNKGGYGVGILNQKWYARGCEPLASDGAQMAADTSNGIPKMWVVSTIIEMVSNERII